MSSSSHKFEYGRRLQSLKTAASKAKKLAKIRRKSMEQTMDELLKKDYDYTYQEESGSQRLQQLVKKARIHNLVDQFVYKIKRNIVCKEPIEYEVIQSTLSQMKSTQGYFKTVKVNEKMVAIFMIANIFAILMIQTLSAFQGFYIAYDKEDSTSVALVVMEYFCLAVFILKLGFSFFCSQNLNGIREKYVRYVVKNYFMSFLFIFDLSNFIMTLLKVIFPTIPLVGIMCFFVTVFSLPVLSKDFEIVQTVFFNNFRRRQFFSVFKIFIFNIFFAQLVSSIMMAISYWDIQNNWIQKASRAGTLPQDLKWWTIYFYSMYWACSTITTIGYGDLIPANYFQVIFVSLLMLIGSAVLSYNLSQIGSVISNLRSINKKRKEETVIFKRMARDEKISEQLMEKILAYIEKSAQIRAQFEFDERKKFLEDLPSQLKQQFNSEYSNYIFSKISFFNLLEPISLIQMSVKLNGQIYYLGQSITKKDGTLPSIMFLKHGIVGFAYRKENSILNGLVLQKRQINREQDSPYLLNKYLLTADTEINYQIVAQNYCFLLTLKYQDFHDVLRENKKDNEFYFSLYNRVSYIDEEWDRFECKYCAPKKHTVFMCPKLHYMPYKSIVVQRQIFGHCVPQRRVTIYKRKQPQVKRKKALGFWKEFFKLVEIQFAVGYMKKGKKRVHFKEQKQQDQQQVGAKDTQQMFRLAEQILRSHCCALDIKYQTEREMNIDKMHNFVHFFPEFNPSKIKMISLNSPPKFKTLIKLSG